MIDVADPQLFLPTAGHRPTRRAAPLSKAAPFVGLAACLVILVAVATVSQASAGRLAAATHWTVHTHQVIEELQRILYGINLSDSAARGFAVGRDESFLRELEGETEEILAATAQVRRLTGDNQTQQERLDRLEPLLADRARLLRVYLDDLRSGQSQPISLGAYRPARSAQSLAEEMIREERDLLARRVETERAGDATLRQVLRGGVAICALLLLGALLLLYREGRRRRSIEAELRAKNELLHSIVNGTGDAIFLKDLQGRYLLSNTAGVRLLDQTPKMSPERTRNAVADGARGTLLAEHDLSVMRSGETRTFEEVLIVDGVERVHSVTRAPYRDAQGRLSGLIATSRDITAWRAEEQAHLQEVTLLLQTGELLQACHGVEEAYRVIGTAAPRFFSETSGTVFMFPRSRDLLEARTSWGCNAPAPLPGGFLPEACWALRRGQPHFVADSAHGLVCPHVTSPFPVSTLCQPLVAQGDLIGILYLAATSTIKEDLLRRAGLVGEQVSMALANLGLRDTLRNQSTRDPLTGLFNRRYLEETLERELQRAIRTNEPLGVLMIDVDNFKRFNDEHGHEVGDNVLREVASILRRATRAGDVASRMGGEEMVVLLPGADLVQAERKADQLRDEIAHLQMKHLGTPLGQVTISVGVAALPDHGHRGAELLRVADCAMYRSKQEGRNRVSVGPRSHN
jgi:diguanylate cyclase (GGDEF)-like protein/PAS domain S-box-containing protein